MEHIREYIFSVTAGALLCGIVRGIAGEKGSTAGILRTVCGIFLSITVLSPFMDIELKELSRFTSQFLPEAQSAVDEGVDYAASARARLIKEQTEAYILDKAASFHAAIEVEVYLSREDPPVPVGCVIRGDVSPYVRQQMKALLESDLGISREDQQWIP